MEGYCVLTVHRVGSRWMQFDADTALAFLVCYGRKPPIKIISWALGSPTNIVFCFTTQWKGGICLLSKKNSVRRFTYLFGHVQLYVIRLDTDRNQGWRQSNCHLITRIWKKTERQKPIQKLAMIKNRVFFQPNTAI